MKGKLFTMIGLVVLVFFAGASSTAGQQGQRDGVTALQAPISVEGMVASKISYQGVLRENGSLVTGTRNMNFILFGSSNCTVASLAVVSAINVPVVNGLFSVAIDVNPVFFDGRGLWLRVQVEGTNIGCQEVLPAPYALNLRPGATISGGSTQLSLNSTTGNALVATTSTTGGDTTAVEFRQEHRNNRWQSRSHGRDR